MKDIKALNGSGVRLGCVQAWMAEVLGSLTSITNNVLEPLRLPQRLLSKLKSKGAACLITQGNAAPACLLRLAPASCIWLSCHTDPTAEDHFCHPSEVFALWVSSVLGNENTLFSSSGTTGMCLCCFVRNVYAGRVHRLIPDKGLEHREGILSAQQTSSFLLWSLWSTSSSSSFLCSSLKGHNHIIPSGLLHSCVRLCSLPSFLSRRQQLILSRGFMVLIYSFIALLECGQPMTSLDVAWRPGDAPKLGIHLDFPCCFHVHVSSNASTYLTTDWCC